MPPEGCSTTPRLHRNCQGSCFSSARSSRESVLRWDIPDRTCRPSAAEAASGKRSIMVSPMACTMHATEHPAKHLSKTCPCSPRPMLRLGTRSPCAGQQAVQPHREARTPLRRARTFSSALDDDWVGDAIIENPPSTPQGSDRDERASRMKRREVAVDHPSRHTLGRGQPLIA